MAIYDHQLTSHAYGWNQISQKTARNFWTILRLLLEGIISFHIILVSQLDALVGEAGIPRSIDKRKEPYMAIYGNQLTSYAYCWSQISQKRLEFFNNTSSPTKG